MLMPARDPPLGDGHKKAKHVMGQEQPGLSIKNKKKNPYRSRHTTEVRKCIHNFARPQGYH